LFEVVLVGGLALLYPRIVRKGLLFGVYVGERAFEGDEARRITRGWDRGMLTSMAASLVLGGVLAFSSTEPFAVIVPVPALFAASLAFYLQAYFRAGRLAPGGPPPAAVAPLAPTPPARAALPAITLAAGVACGAFAIAYSWVHYAELPDMVPTHFGPSGAPDAWRPKSFFTVMLLPIGVLVMGSILGGVAWLTAHAKRALRRSAEAASLEAQLRFRAAITRYLCGAAILVMVLLTSISIQSVRVGLGESRRLSSAVAVVGVLVVVYAIAGTVYLALRYGQGGARIEKARADTPLTNGLADNRHWVLGTFYVNRDDPSFLVEHRFGLGYTLNFGNPRAVALLAVFAVLIVALVVLSLVTT
jgi:uncharacterized membrane protein